jgi:hypothetical protein
MIFLLVSFSALIELFRRWLRSGFGSLLSFARQTGVPDEDNNHGGTSDFKLGPGMQASANRALHESTP